MTKNENKQKTNKSQINKTKKTEHSATLIEPKSVEDLQSQILLQKIAVLCLFTIWQESRNPS